jgi:AcrR family transcriptional regulator
MAESNHAGGEPIWVRPEPATRSPRFSRQQIAAAALAIADADGFEAVTMRRIARSLGAGTMSLYRYIATKDDLLALIGDALLGEAIVPGELPADWRTAIAMVARQTRAAYLRHSWAAHFIQMAAAVGAAPTGPNGLRHVEQSLAALSGAPMDARTKLDVLAIVDDYVFGHLLRAAGIMTGTAAGTATAEGTGTAEFIRAQLASGDFPELAAVISAPDAAPATDPPDVDARFELGLRLLLDGIAAGFR